MGEELLNKREQPLYKQIKDIIMEQILNGRLAVGNTIPSEAALCKKFKVSRYTVRQALSELTQEGFLSRHPGKGTFVQPWANIREQKRIKAGRKQIGLVLPYENYAHTGDIIKGVESEATALDYRVVFVNINNVSDEWSILEQLYQEGLEGLIYYFNDLENIEKNIIRLRECDFPFVLVDHYLLNVTTDYVASDNFLGAYNAINHLLELGHKKIAILFPNGSMTSVTQRLTGYRKALQRAGITPNPKLEIIKNKKIYTDEEIKEILTIPQLTALFTTDLLAVRVLKIARELDIEIPGQLSLVGFDDISLGKQLVPALTTVKQQSEEMGREAVRILEKKIKGYSAITQLVLPTKLIVRDSTGKAI